MIVVDADRTRAALPFPELIAAIKAMFVEGCVVPLRHTHSMDTGGGTTGTVLLMPAWQTGRRLGVKIVNVFPRNSAIDVPGLHSNYLLYDAQTGVPLAQIDGNEITSRRTAAASALAAGMLARADAHSLLVVGAGRVANLLPDAYATVRDIRDVRVWDINADLARKMVTRLAGEGVRAAVADDLESAARAADIITCATLSTQPLILGRWLRPGVHLDLIGGFTPEMRESDDECYERADVFVDTPEAVAKAGDLLKPMQRGVFKESDVRADLQALCRGMHPGRQAPEQITVYKAVGTALEDLAAASLVYDRIL